MIDFFWQKVVVIDIGSASVRAGILGEQGMSFNIESEIALTYLFFYVLSFTSFKD